MKKWKKYIMSVLVFALPLLLWADVTAAAVPYTYTVTLSAGNKGLINGESRVNVTGVALGGRVSFDMSQIQVTDEKYYVKGIRLSGRDNEETLAATAFRVYEDIDYVVAYGIRGNVVAYTVQYLDAEGNSLAPNSTFYGNIGDRPVVAYRYINDYVPQALALTQTLEADENENVFTFVYTPGESGIVTTTRTEVITVVDNPAPSQTTGETTGNENTSADENVPADENTPIISTEETVSTEEDTTLNQGSTEELPDQQVPEDLIDLDDEKVPEGNIELENNSQGNHTRIWVGIGIAAASIAGLATLILVLRKKAGK